MSNFYTNITFIMPLFFLPFFCCAEQPVTVLPWVAQQERPIKRILDKIKDQGITLYLESPKKASSHYKAEMYLDFRASKGPESLYDEYLFNLQQAENAKYSSIEFPPVKVQVFGGDKKLCAFQVVRALCDHASGARIKEIYLVITDDEYLQFIKDELER